MKISEADLARIGVTQRDLQHNLQHPDHGECCRRLDEMKARAKKTFHKLAMDMHPDRNPQADQELFKNITAAYDWVMNLELTRNQRPPPRPPQQHHQVVIIRTGGNWTTNGWTTNSTSSTTTTWGW
jgi:hypothetical protein